MKVIGSAMAHDVFLTTMILRAFSVVRRLSVTCIVRNVRGTGRSDVRNREKVLSRAARASLSLGRRNLVLYATTSSLIPRFTFAFLRRRAKKRRTYRDSVCRTN